MLSVVICAKVFLKLSLISFGLENRSGKNVSDLSFNVRSLLKFPTSQHLSSRFNLIVSMHNTVSCSATASINWISSCLLTEISRDVRDVDRFHFLTSCNASNSKQFRTNTFRFGNRTKQPPNNSASKSLWTPSSVSSCTFSSTFSPNTTLRSRLRKFLLFTDLGLDSSSRTRTHGNLRTSSPFISNSSTLSGFNRSRRPSR